MVTLIRLLVWNQKFIVVNRKIPQCKSLSEEKKCFNTVFVEEVVEETLFNIEKNHNDDLFVPRTVLLMKNKVS